MKLKGKKEHSEWNRIGYHITFTLIVFIVTFRNWSPEITTGLDGSYVWALNWLFDHEYSALLEKVYPIGPLGFLLFPTSIGQNLLIAIVFYSILKLIFINLLLSLAKDETSMVPAFLISLLACYVANLDFLIIGSCLALSFIYLSTRDIRYILLGSILAALGLCIKSSIGISCLSIVMLSPLCLGVQWSHRWRVMMVYVWSSLVFIVVGLVVFRGRLQDLITYLVNIVHLTDGYSETLSLHPENNWLLLGLMLVAIFSIFIFLKERTNKASFILMLFPLFASWKHAMTREDIFHYPIFLCALVVFGCILILSIKQRREIILSVLCGAIVLYYSNMSVIPMYRPLQKEIIGVNQLAEVMKFDLFKSNAEIVSQQNLHEKLLPDEIKSIIGQESVDIYPWELSYVPANDLNWSPRPSLEIGASTSRWVSNQAAFHFSDPNSSPQFVLMHLNPDRYTGTMGSLDDRYILNDEPQVIDALLSNYDLVYKSSALLLFEKRSARRQEAPSHLKPVVIELGEWIEIPNYNEGITRLKLDIEKTVLGSIQTFLYKEAAYFIDYQLDDDEILSYRFVPSTAKDGLWINPFITDASNAVVSGSVKRIRIRYAYSKLIQDRISANIEYLPFKFNMDSTLNQNPVSVYFWKEKVMEEPIFQRIFHFEEEEYIIDSSSPVYSGMGALKVQPGGFSVSFEIALDSIWNDVDSSSVALSLSSSVMSLSSAKGALLVIEGLNADIDLWKGEELVSEGIHDQWNPKFISHRLEREFFSDAIIKVYIWNPSTEIVYVDDFKIILAPIR